MKLYPYGKLLNQMTTDNLLDICGHDDYVGLFVLGKNGNVGYVEDTANIRGEPSLVLRWMHGGSSEWYLDKLDLEVLTPNIKKSPMPETIMRTERSIDWHRNAREILCASPIVSVEILDYSQCKEVQAETLAFLKAKGYDSDVLLIRFQNGCEIAVYDQENQRCCEQRFIKTADDLSSLVGELFVRLDVVDVENPEPYVDNEVERDDCIDQTFIKIQTNRDSATVNAYNLSNGHYGNLVPAVCVYVPHPKLDRPNTPYIRTEEPGEHKELEYNLNTMLRRLNIHVDRIDRSN